MNTAKRETQRGDWGSIDGKFIRVFGPEVGTSGIAVYAVLSCGGYLNFETQEVELSQQEIARLSKQSKGSVQRALGLLEHHGLIKIMNTRKGNRVGCNRYRLLPIPAAVNPRPFKLIRNPASMGQLSLFPSQHKLKSVPESSPASPEKNLESSPASQPAASESPTERPVGVPPYKREKEDLKTDFASPGGERQVGKQPTTKEVTYEIGMTNDLDEFRKLAKHSPELEQASLGYPDSLVAPAFARARRIVGEDYAKPYKRRALADVLWQQLELADRQQYAA